MKVMKKEIMCIAFYKYKRDSHLIGIIKIILRTEISFRFRFLLLSYYCHLLFDTARNTWTSEMFCLQVDSDCVWQQHSTVISAIKCKTQLGEILYCNIYKTAKNLPVLCVSFYTRKFNCCKIIEVARKQWEFTNVWSWYHFHSGES